MLNVQNMSAYYGGAAALHDVSFGLDEGGFLAVVGRNGVGKSTLLRSIMGLMDRCEGKITFNGEEIGDLPTHSRAKHGIGLVPQGRGILPQFTVRENLKLGTFARKDGRIGEIDDAVYELFPVLKEMLSRVAGNLSGGQQQQLAIARAMLVDPSMILLDEPTEGVQPNIVTQIEHAITTLNKDLGIGILLVEQDLRFARRAASKFVLLENGRVVEKGNIDELTEELVHRHMAI